MGSYGHYLKNRHPKSFDGLSDAICEEFNRLSSRGHSLADLVSHYGASFGHLPRERLLLLKNEFVGYRAWSKRMEQVAELRSRSGETPIPTTVLERTHSPDELDAVVRTAQLNPRSDFPKGSAGDKTWHRALIAGAELWRACMRLARKEGSVSSKQAQDVSVDAAANYDDYLLDRQELASIAPHRWLAMRRGEREGVLTLTFTLPLEGFAEQVAHYRKSFSDSSADRSDDSLVEELITLDFASWLTRLLDYEAQQQAINQACENFRGLLEQTARPRRLAAVFAARGKQPVGVVTVDAEGDLTQGKALKQQSGWIERAIELLQGQQVSQVVLPSTSDATTNTVAERLAEADFQILRARVAALAEARAPLTAPPLRLGPSVASALVLARRVLDPLKEWGNVDPVAIGIAEYQNDLNEARLRAALKETLELCRMARRQPKSGDRSGDRAERNRPRARPAAKAPTPLVKSIADLRPGMAVEGVVSNISHFGAFVNIGLPFEGLVHVSELSDEFVNNPNEVVAIGDQVKAKVISVDTARRRISLTMKSTVRQPSNERPRSSRPKNKAQALASLEDLFKK